MLQSIKRILFQIKAKYSVLFDINDLGLFGLSELDAVEEKFCKSSAVTGDWYSELNKLV